MDAGHEGVVEGTHAVGGQEKDTFIIFECSKEPWNWSVIHAYATGSAAV